MSELCSAGVWRAATCVLAAGWVVVACGGGDDDVAVGAPGVAVVSAQPAAVLSTASVHPDAPNEPCRPLPQAVPVARRDTARLEREFVEELRGEMAVGVGPGAGAVDVVDPFESR
ncbi:MAG: hypothetical protein Tsb007_47360 [Rhizobacter sp.]